MRDINLGGSNIHYQRAGLDGTNDEATLPSAARPQQASTTVVPSTAATVQLEVVVDGIHHMAAQLSTTQALPSSAASSGTASAIVPLTFAEPLAAESTARREQAQHSANQQAEVGRGRSSSSADASAWVAAACRVIN